jgi:alpha-galactosidase
MKKTWTDFLKDILPSNWNWKDSDAFCFDDNNGRIVWQNSSSKSQCGVLTEEYESDSLKLKMVITKYPQEKTFMVKSFLTNTGFVDYPLNHIQLIDLNFDSENGPIHFRTIDGGENLKHYPPEIFRINDYLCDGSSGIWRESGWDGRSSEKTLPLLGMEVNGDSVIAGLEWSGLWWGATNGQDNDGTPAAGHLFIHIPVAGLAIKAGETFEFPAAHITFSNEGIAGAGNNCRHHIANNILPPLNGKRMDKPPVVYNHWFGLGPNINEEILMKQADKAAEIGAEYFVLDAGWYGDCDGDDFERGVGNWEDIDHSKFPNGLKPLADYVHKQGVKFGIWFEPERAHVTSDWYRRHPEWFLKKGDENENSHIHIDMSRSDVQENVVRVISNTIKELGVEWIKWDYNINPKAYWEKNDPTGRLMFEYMKGLYATQQKLLDLHPGVVFECCASGGRRIDLGQMRRTHSALLSDSVSSSLVCRYMQSGANNFMPSSYIGVGLAFGDIDNTSNSSEGTLRDFQLLSRMSGTPIIFGDIASLSNKQLHVLKNNIETFKQWRHLLNQDFFELLPQPKHQDDYAALEFISEKRNEAVILVFSGPEKLRYLKRIHPKALLKDKVYTAEVISGTMIPVKDGFGKDLMTNGWEISLEPRDAVAIRLRYT